MVSDEASGETGEVLSASTDTVGTEAMASRVLVVLGDKLLLR